MQGHRFDIIEGYGCRPTAYFSIPAIFIIWVPPIFMSTIAILFAGLALRHFIIRRLSFATHLRSTNSAITTSSYLRLMTMAALQMVWSITVTSYSLWFTSQSMVIRPWTTWADVHSDWLRVDVFPAAFTPPFIKQSFYILWWMVPFSTMLFVAFFSFGKDAMEEYKNCINWVRNKFCRQYSTKASGNGESHWMKLSSTTTNSIRESSISKSQVSENPPQYDEMRASYVIQNKKSSTGDMESECHSEMTQYVSPMSRIGDPKAMGSFADLPIPTPSTLVTPPMQTPMFVASSLGTPASLPLPANSRLWPFMRLNPPCQTSRPISYPSFEAARRGVNVSRSDVQ